ncbi:MAG TPA: HAD family hydrolase [Polyangiaceae bacterium]|nr:HAD family hydrolase [Polyangiaceae bacterium]
MSSILPPVLLFDLDDTIVRFSTGQPNFWQLALESHVPQLAEHHPRLCALIDAASQEYWSEPERAFLGRQDMYAARRYVARAVLEAEGISEELCQRFADDVTDRKEAYVHPFEGALETLQVLRAQGHRLALLTNGSALFQRRKLQRFALEPFFELILIEGELGYGKPDPRVFQAALDFFAASPQSAWMIGDNLQADIAGAQQLGIDGIWHDPDGRGLPERPPAVPRRIIRQVSELLDLAGVGAARAPELQ